MSEITISKKNESFINIDCELGILYEIKEHFTFFVEGYKHMPKFKAGIWDGKVSLLDIRFGTLPLGLTDELLDVAKRLGYEVTVDRNSYGAPGDKEVVLYEDVEKWINGLNLSSKNKPLQIRKHQVDSIFNCIRNKRLISITPTGGGKSLIAYCLFRWYVEHGAEHVMLVVPNLGLIKQMYSDFLDYSGLNGFDMTGSTQVIAEGSGKIINKPFVLCTWQSVFKQTSAWFKSIDVLIADEAHQYKAEAIRNIFDRATETKYKFGLTGSLDKSAVNKLVLKGLIGEISRVKSTRDLINDGHLSEIAIKCVVLKYSGETSTVSKKFDYQKELDFLFQHNARNKFIRNLALSLKGNTLILFGRVETHGEPLYEDIKSKATNQQVHFVSGKVEADDRERIRKLVQESDESNIIVGSFGTVSTGVNIPRLHNIIFAAPSKSIIRVMQSIGRGLRKADDKTHMTLYDISDALCKSKTKPNYTMVHFVERLKLYVEEGHPYKIVEVEIEK